MVVVEVSLWNYMSVLSRNAIPKQTRGTSPPVGLRPSHGVLGSNVLNCEAR